MRTCEAGACTKPATYRGSRDELGAAAWCDEHVPVLVPYWTAEGTVKFLYAPGVEPIPGAQLQPGAEFTEGTLPPGVEPRTIQTPKGVLP